MGKQIVIRRHSQVLKEFMTFGAAGVTGVAAGVLSLFENPHPWLSAAVLAITLCIIVLIIFGNVLLWEADDETADKNRCRAAYWALHVQAVVTGLAGLASIFTKKKIRIISAASFSYALANILYMAFLFIFEHRMKKLAQEPFDDACGRLSDDPEK